jgi:hypothetical protein
MVTFPCPWCERELALPAAADSSEVRCEACATTVELAPAPDRQPVMTLPLAA